MSAWVPNVHLSLLSLPLGAATALATDGAAIASKGFLFGYDAFVWSLVCLSALGDLLVAMVVRHADTITKGFATSFAPVLSSIVSVAFLDLVMTTQFAVGAVLVLASVFLYGSPPSSRGPSTPRQGSRGT